MKKAFFYLLIIAHLTSPLSSDEPPPKASIESIHAATSLVWASVGIGFLVVMGVIVLIAIYDSK